MRGKIESDKQEAGVNVDDGGGKPTATYLFDTEVAIRFIRIILFLLGLNVGKKSASWFDVPHVYVTFSRQGFWPYGAV